MKITYPATEIRIGNFPKVNNTEIPYVQIVVFKPSDLTFLFTGIKAETIPDTEMTLIIDIDLDLLKELHEHGNA